MVQGEAVIIESINRIINTSNKTFQFLGQMLKSLLEVRSDFCFNLLNQIVKILRVLAEHLRHKQPPLPVFSMLSNIPQPFYQECILKLPTRISQRFINSSKNCKSSAAGRLCSLILGKELKIQFRNNVICHCVYSARAGKKNGLEDERL